MSFICAIWSYNPKKYVGGLELSQLIVTAFPLINYGNLNSFSFEQWKIRICCLTQTHTILIRHLYLSHVIQVSLGVIILSFLAVNHTRKFDPLTFSNVVYSNDDLSLIASTIAFFQEEFREHLQSFSFIRYRLFSLIAYFFASYHSLRKASITFNSESHIDI